MNPQLIAAAIAFVKNKLGLSNIPPSEWSYDTRIQYNKALSEYLIQHADDFSPAHVNIARAVQDAVYSPLSDVSYAADIAVFGNEFAAQALRAGEGVAAIGNGVIDTAKMAKWVIPAAALVIVFILLRKFEKA